MKRKFGNLLLWFSLAITLSLFVLAKFSGGGSFSFGWLTLSQLLSLLGTTLLAFSFLLSSRFSFLEDWFGGLDKVYRLHHITGGLSFVLLLHHPLFLLIDVLPDIGFGWKYLWFSNLLPYDWGVASLYFMLLMILLTLFIRLPYSVWKKTHELMGIALIFAVLHILTISSDVSRYMPLRYWIIFLLIVSIASAFYRRFLYRILGPKFLFTIKTLERRGDVLVVGLQSSGRQMNPWPGQFIFIRFDGMGNETHPFSIASIGLDGSIRIGIKILGDHTLQMVNLKVGDKATSWGPYGKFWESYMSKKDLIMIAGGIGITPFISMVEKESQSASSRKIDLIYCVKTEDEAVFDLDLKALSVNIDRINYSLYTSEKLGHIDAEKIIGIVGPVENKKIMICGPDIMMNSLAEQFLSLGVKNKDIIFEDFNFK